MKRHATVILLSALTVFVTLFAFNCLAAEEENTAVNPEFTEESPAVNAEFTIARLVIAGSVENSEPVGVVNAFSSTTEKVYCFLEAREITEDISIVFAWYHEDNKKADVELSLRKGSRWRTYSSKKLGGLKGNWKVDLNDAVGNVLETVAFTVE